MLQQSLIIALYCFAIAAAVAQQPVTIDLNETEDLPDVEFYDIIEDKGGFIWLAASNGLYRFDGKEFKKYTHPDQKGLSIFDLNLDKDGRIWCNNLAGQLLYAQGDSLHLFKDIGPEIDHHLIDIILQGEYLYAFSLLEIVSVHLRTKESKTIFAPKDRVGAPSVIANKLRFNCGDTLYTIRKDQVVALQSGEVVKGGIQEETKDAYVFGGGAYLFLLKYFGYYSLYKIDIRQKKFVPIPIPEVLEGLQIVCVQSKEDKYWFSTLKGVFVFTFQNGAFQLKAHYLGDHFISKSFTDSQGNHWLTTLDNGIFVMPNIHLTEIDLPKSVNKISQLVKISDSSVVMGTAKGELHRYDQQTGQIHQLPQVSKEQVLYISPLLESQSFIAAYAEDAFLYKDDTAQPLGEYSTLVVKSISALPGDRILLGNYSSARIARRNKTSLQYEEEKFLRGKRVRNTFYDSAYQDKYVGYIDQLIRYDSNLVAKEIQFRSKPIFTIDMGSTIDGTIWIASANKGLLGLRRDSIVYQYTLENGLLSNTLFHLTTDSQCVWLATDKGIQKINPQSGTIQSLTKSDGMPSYHVSGMAILGNDLLFATNKGLFSLGKNQLSSKSSFPSIYFTGVAINNRDTSILPSYQLPYHKNNLDISFFSNGFQSDESIAYQYRLKSTTNEKWKQLPMGISNIQFNSLSPGSYRFEVQAVNPKQGTQSKSIAIDIRILKPYWRQLWFQLSIGGLVALLLSLIIGQQMKVREEKQRILFKQLEQEKALISANLESLRSQMNPHFIFNALTAIQEYIMMNEKILASEYLVKFSRLIRMYLEHSQEDMIPIAREIEALRLYLALEKERFENSIDIQLDIDPQLDLTAHTIPSLLIQPYVENAIKHGLLHRLDKRSLLIQFTKREDAILCTVRDNGVGRKRAMEIQRSRNPKHVSFATSANQVRLSLINQNSEPPIVVDVQDLYEQGNAAGTQVNITIPTTTKAII
ncbi:MAG: histidine kinase [Bacteroidota bacterium]